MRSDAETVQAIAMVPRTPINVIEGSPQMVVCAVVQAPQIDGRGVTLSVVRRVDGDSGSNGGGRMNVMLFEAPEQRRVKRHLGEAGFGGVGFAVGSWIRRVGGC